MRDEPGKEQEWRGAGQVGGIHIIMTVRRDLLMQEITHVIQSHDTHYDPAKDVNRGNSCFAHAGV